MLVKAADYGIIKIAVNDQILVEKLDLYNQGVITTEIPLGRAPLKQGANEMKITLTGANPRAVKRHMFGLDYLLIKKID